MLIPQFTIVKDFEMLNFFVLSDWQLKRKKDKLNINERVKTYISIIYVAIIVFIFLQKPTWLSKFGKPRAWASRAILFLRLCDCIKSHYFSIFYLENMGRLDRVTWCS